ncbi:LacI family DNA-binding transcriptional regulator [Tropicimonas aquimaris]|uniref:LacI family DNA-binding transcriptional regulator n=1 Tax=Tropicimonas aquimaris TaxID=914152 RepID=A0ABW3IQA5_9RHOB
MTLKTVAATAGVSVSAVSLALRDSPRISEDKRAEIKRIASELGYIYNRHAANLRTGTNDTVSVCVNDLRNPVFAEFVTSIEEALRESDRLVLLCNAHEEEEVQASFIRRMLEQGSNGLVLSPVAGTRAEALREVVGPQFPTVLMSRGLDDESFDQVVNDDPLGIRMAVHALVQLGHSKIGWIGGGQDTSTARGRFEGFKTGLREAGLPIDPTLVLPTSHTTLEAGRRAMIQILDAAPEVTGVLCFGDLLALGAVSACRERGLEVGRDISIIGHDDIEETAYFEPALSTVHVRKRMIGRTAAELLLQRIDAPFATPVSRVIAPRLVFRGTTGPAP